MKIVLASKSPRRQELMKLLPYDFSIEEPQVDEKIDYNMTMEKIAESIAFQKAQAVFESQKNCLVIGADTIVVHDGEVLGKPKDENEAFEMLKKLSGKTHEVITGVCLKTHEKTMTFSCVTSVTFFPLSDEEIRSYIKSGEPMDKAGAYGIQGFGALFVEKINGDYFNVVGLPISMLYKNLKNFLK